MSKVARAAPETGGTATIQSARHRWRRRTLRGILYGYLVVGALAVLVPYFWMLSASLKPRGEIFRVGINFLPQQPIIDNYLAALDGFPIIRWLVNSFLIG